MGDNIHQLTSLPYSNFEDEHSEEGHTDHIPNLHVENVTSSGRKPKLAEKFHTLTKEKKITIVLAILLIALSVFTIIYASVEKHRKPLEDHLAKCRSLKVHERIDAGFGIAKSKQHCSMWGGCWDGTATGSPMCYYPYTNLRGYRVVENNIKVWGMEIDLERIDKLDTLFSSESQYLKCIISYETDSRLRVKIFDPNSKDRYEVPMSSHHEVSGHRMQYILSITRGMFGFSVSRTHEASSTIFNTTMEGLIYSDQVMQLVMSLSSSNVYGLSGDHKDGLLRKMEYGYQSIWATSVEQRHGAHPFLLHVEKDGHASGFFLQNSNAMDVILSPYPAITFRTTGGILDFYIFLGPTPADVMAQFADKIGKPFLPPLWALGYHFGSEGYEKSEDLELSSLINESFPLDGVWLGRSTLRDSHEFTLDSDRFPGMEEIVATLHDNNKLLLVHARPAILVNGSLYSEKSENFVRDHSSKTLIVEVAAGRAVLPDYFHPDTVTWLQDALSNYRTSLAFDGVFLDENEPSTQSNGSVSGCTQTNLDIAIYTLKTVPKLKTKTLCPSARHYGGLRHNDVHNIYGWKSSLITCQALASVIPDKRSLQLSRSTYLGSGAHTGHFIMENTATWEDMRHSIVAMLNYNMYGIPLVGANICGYKSGVKSEDRDTEEEMCVRWHQLAIFYPFAKRYHSTETSMLKFGEDAVRRIREAMERRYSLLPTLYTLFYSAHTRGLPVVSPLFFDYLNDGDALTVETQFMFGEGIMVAPVLLPIANSTVNTVYFPKDLWYDYENPLAIVNEAGYVNQSVSLDKQTYYVRGGHTVVTHANPASNTREINESGDYILDVYLSSRGLSFGELYTDNGVSLHTISHDQFLYVKFNASQAFIRSEVTMRYPGHNNNNKIQEINVRGLTNAPNTVSVNNGTDVIDFVYKDGVLCIKSLGLPIVEAFMVTYS